MTESLPFLDKNQPVVVYTNTGLKGSVVWFALTLQGYDARLYSYENYLYNQAALARRMRLMRRLE